MRWKVLLVSIILGSAPLGFAQSSNKPATISLGGDLTLGLPRGQVLSMLQRTYDLQKTEDKDETYLVEDKASKSNRVVGVVTFTAGKLSCFSFGRFFIRLVVYIRYEIVHRIDVFSKESRHGVSGGSLEMR